MLKQSLNFKLSQKLSPQQIQLMKMIQLPTQAFEERLKQEIEENPALDTGKEESDDFEDSLENDFEDDGTEKIDAEDINIDDYLSDDEIPNYKTQANNYSSDDEEKHVPYAAGKTFHQSLREQLNTCRLLDEENAIAEFLVGSIDDSGYIRRDFAVKSFSGRHRRLIFGKPKVRGSSHLRQTPVALSRRSFHFFKACPPGLN